MRITNPLEIVRNSVSQSLPPPSPECLPGSACSSLVESGVSICASRRCRIWHKGNAWYLGRALFALKRGSSHLGRLPQLLLGWLQSPEILSRARPVRGPAVPKTQPIAARSCCISRNERGCARLPARRVANTDSALPAPAFQGAGELPKPLGESPCWPAGTSMAALAGRSLGTLLLDSAAACLSTMPKFSHNFGCRDSQTHDSGLKKESQSVASFQTFSASLRSL